LWGAGDLFFTKSQNCSRQMEKEAQLKGQYQRDYLQVPQVTQDHGLRLFEDLIWEKMEIESMRGKHLRETRGKEKRELNKQGEGPQRREWINWRKGAN